MYTIVNIPASWCERPSITDELERNCAATEASESTVTLRGSCQVNYFQIQETPCGSANPGMHDRSTS